MLPTKPVFATLAAVATILAFAPFAVAEPSSSPQASAAQPSREIMMVNLQTTLEKSIDAKKSKAGDPVVAKVNAAAVLNDGTRVPSGSLLEGHIDSITPSENKSDSAVVFTFDKLQIKNGQELGVKATVIQVSSLSSAFAQDKGTPDPAAHRPGAAGGSGLNSPSMQGQPQAQPQHGIEGLTLTGTVHDPTSATIT
jgi:hypothetical protein